MTNSVSVEDISKFQLSVHQTYKEHPSLALLLDKLEHISDFEFWNYKSEFTDLLSSDFVEMAVNKELSAFLEEQYYQLPLYFNNDRAKGWVVISTPYFKFNIYFFDSNLINQHRKNNTETKFSIQTTSQDVIMYFPEAKGAELDIYEVNEGENSVDAGPSMKLSQSVKLQDGQYIHLQAGKNAIHFKDVKEDMSYFEITGVSSDVRVIGEYDLRTLNLIGVSAANLSSSRAEMFSEMVANLQHKPSVPVLEKLCSHKDHFVRWAAATSLYSLDEESGKRVIFDLTSDPHPDVRNTASQCINIFANQ